MLTDHEREIVKLCLAASVAGGFIALFIQSSVFWALDAFHALRDARRAGGGHAE